MLKTTEGKATDPALKLLPAGVSPEPIIIRTVL